jgi:HEAT repeat protein
MIWWATRQLKTASSASRVRAARTLARSGSRKAIVPLFAAFISGDLDVKVATLDALKSIDVNWRRTTEFIAALSEIERKPAIEAAVRALASGNAEIESVALDVLQLIDSNWRRSAELDPWFESIATILTHVDRSALERSGKQPYVRTLGLIGDDRAIQLLAIALKDKNEYVQEEAARALASIGGTSVVEPLLIALRKANPYAARPAAVALGEIGDRRAITPLVVALTASDDSVRSTVREVLAKMDRNWSQSAEAKIAVPALVAALRTSWSPTIDAAIQTLSDIGEKTAIGLLVATTDDREHVIDAAVDALERLDPNWRQSDETRSAVPTLIAGLKTGDRPARLAAVKMLGEIGDEIAVEPLSVFAREKEEGDLSAMATAAVRKIEAARLMGKALVARKDDVVFVKEEQRMILGQLMTYRVHKGPDGVSARAFLADNPVTRDHYYIVVETPDGNYCRDRSSTYKE